MDPSALQAAHGVGCEQKGCHSMRLRPPLAPCKGKLSQILQVGQVPSTCWRSQTCGFKPHLSRLSKSQGGGVCDHSFGSCQTHGAQGTTPGVKRCPTPPQAVLRLRGFIKAQKGHTAPTSASELVTAFCFRRGRCPNCSLAGPPQG